MSMMRPRTSLRDELNRLFYEMDRELFAPLAATSTQGGEQTLAGTWTPPVDIHEEDHQLVITMALPGFEPDHVTVEVENNIVSISGESRQETEEKTKSFHRREIQTGQFRREFKLPVDVEGDKAEARFEKGLLSLSLPKAQKSKKHQVKINGH